MKRKGLNCLFKVFLDTNIFLNVIFEEKEFLESSESLLKEIHRGRIQGLSSTLSIHEIGLVLKEKGKFGDFEKAIFAIEDIKNHEIVSLDKESVILGTKLLEKYDFTSFDSLLLASSIVKNVDFFVSRDDQLKKIKEIRVMNPEEILKILFGH